ncbi:MAG TPA: alpha/beta fold hydrolase [Propionibacteriaceae bacterium]|nr:alpha/beta fold hydrolase [Propionibacteriaceae bacterium]
MKAAEGILGPNPFVGLRPEDVLETIRAVCNASLRQPTLVLEQQAKLARELYQVLTGSSAAKPAPGDRRFSDLAWTENALYRAWLQVYLAWRSRLNEFIDQLELDRMSKDRARFIAALVTEALAPTNFLLGNPGALKKAVETKGVSIVDGLKNMLEDLVSNNAMPAQVDKTAFELGKNVAVSAGAVVFSNEVLELIQYAPTTAQVHARPHLIVPPQINKFYVFDLSPGKSIVEHLLNSGFQVFVVSWRNPTADHCEWNLDTYVRALLQAIEATCGICASDSINLHGACSGAMTMSALLGYLAATGDTRVSAATMMVAVLGRNPDSQLGLFVTPETIAAAKAKSALKGVLDGHEMGTVFAWLRPNDLVWNYWVNNYLMGNRPPQLDILFWNNDSTRLPARFHAQLLDAFAERLFERPGVLNVLGVPINLKQVTCDKFVVAGLTDHITSWKGVYSSAKLFGGTCEFVLSSSGHIQSLINPPTSLKAKFFINRDISQPADEWLSDAQQFSGSWWDHWVEWLAQRSGPQREAPASLGNEQLKPGALAPGTYVFET